MTARNCIPGLNENQPMRGNLAEAAFGEEIDIRTWYPAICRRHLPIQ